MKKFLVLSALLGSMAFAVPSAEAKTTVSAGAPHASMVVSQPQRRRWNNRRIRVVTRTRITRIGRYRYRETIRTMYLANGRTRTQVIRRVRLGRW